MLTDINRNMKHLQVFKRYGIDLFQHMYLWNRIDIKRDNFKLIPVEPTEIKHEPYREEHIFRFKGLSRKKYNYYLISIVNFGRLGYYTTMTSKIWTHPISLNHHFFNIQKTYMLVIPKTNTPIHPSNRMDLEDLYLDEPTYLRKQDLLNNSHVKKSILLRMIKADKSGYNVHAYRHQLKYRLSIFRRDRIRIEMLRA